ncbi:hypothetical protein CBR_g55072 [Chara braunii]|uniref:Uncharacterized protein n=1 Tax=Chara braunii TaxID=69332 RepID=A0A388MCR6_CHABU|nr:hypothetical protein CBR_g55072 [Chara braunii]|eukprot:GBG92303.1 hypothetical protein CBR_g55072 [Chara braunii]
MTVLSRDYPIVHHPCIVRTDAYSPSAVCDSVPGTVAAPSAPAFSPAASSIGSMAVAAAAASRDDTGEEGRYICKRCTPGVQLYRMDWTRKRMHRLR